MSGMDGLSVEQVARIAWLAGSGHTADEIAGDMRVSVEPNRVKFIIDRLDLPSLTLSQDPVPLRITIPRALMAVLDRAAVARKLGRADMAEIILKSVLNDGIVAAVVDDGVAG